MVSNDTLRDKRQFGFFITENDLFDSGVVAKIGGSAFTVYSYLVRCAGSGSECYPKIETICEATGMSKPTVIRAVDRLIKDEIIGREHTKTVNHYIIRDHLQSKRGLLSESESKDSLPTESKSDTSLLTRRRHNEEDSKKSHGIELTDLPDAVGSDRAIAFIEHRIKLRKPLTQYAFDLAIKQVLKAEAHGLTPNEVIDITIEAGWQGINAEWAKNRICPGSAESIRPRREIK